MNPSQPKPLLVEPAVASLRMVGGVRVEDGASPIVSTPPPDSPYARQGERLFLLVGLTHQATERTYLDLREAVIHTYWASAGSITAALRSTLAAANRLLYQANLNASPAERLYGSLVCAVLSGEDVYILKSGAGCVCIARAGRVETLSDDEQLPTLGIGPVAKVHLAHTRVGLGDVLLMTMPGLVSEGGDERINRPLLSGSVAEALDALSALGTMGDFGALVAAWNEEGVSPAAPAPPVVSPPHLPEAQQESREPEPVRVQAQVPQEAPRERAVPERRKAKRSAPAPKRTRRSGPTVAERVGEALSSAGRAIGSAGTWLGGAAKRFFVRLLPGAERHRRPRVRPPKRPPKENRAVMMALAAVLPAVVAIVVFLAYRDLGAQARFEQFIEGAQQAAQEAEATGADSEAMRLHWTAALSYTNAAKQLKPEDPTAGELYTQARSALDRIDRITRLRPVPLYDFGVGIQPRQLVVQGAMVFVLDPAAGWVAQVVVNPTGDGIDEASTTLALVRTGQPIGGVTVGRLLDLAWVDAESTRQTSGLLVLEAGGALISYNPAWGAESGTPQVLRALLETPSAGAAQAIGSYRGRLYILDPQFNQIWRYLPQGDSYSQSPERYFETTPSVSLQTAIDMAIDGNIYVLDAGGGIYKFFGGGQQPFEVRGLPGTLRQAVALAADPSGNSDVFYVADRNTDYCQGRVVALGVDGAFRTQLCADGNAFESIEALAFDRAMRRLYVLSSGRLYLAMLP
ncbi:MAG: hypothetical protein GX601_06015 [Anaerolineales bacterium]|nr:hypothetical protein [Anaerolineales bacterium]